ncbi:MAG: hypothetical protein CAF41_008200 [Nitrospira sp. CG24A]|nr:MAG: hypothetical protein CAF41_008200 [Nitrospira sp. CG24A]
MSFDQQKLLSLLPAFYRIRDAGVAEQLGLSEGPLAELLGVIAEQIAVIEEDLEQLQDDAFIETCADWVVPYIGDLIGYRTLYGVAPKVANARAEVAHTIAYRRRKGTALVLEQLARDVTGWNASAVEFFQRLITTQYMNHRRTWLHAAPDLRRWEALSHVSTAFDTIPRTIDVRRIASGRGTHNIPNIGLFLWPLDAYPMTGSPAARVDDRRWRVSPLNHDVPLVTRPQTEDDITHLATPLNATVRIGRRVMHERTNDYYSTGPLRKSVRLYVGTIDPLPAIALLDIRICNLSDDGATWAHLPPAGKFAIDPVLGRIALPPGLPANTRARVDYHYAFGADLGGGEYERAGSFAEPAATVPLRVPQDHATIQAALTALGGQGVVEITDSGRYEETLSIDVAASQRIELRAANGHRPTLILNGEFNLRGGDDSEIALNGLLISGHRLRVPATASNLLRRLHLRHCTLVPGWTLAADGTPQSPSEPGLLVEIADLKLRAEHCILGGLRVVEGAEAILQDCILDATALSRIAYAALDGNSRGGSLTLDACTAIGKLHALSFPMISNSILVAELGAADPWAAPIIAARRQQGCVRFSYVPLLARTPRRFRCVPGEDTMSSPVLRFTSLRYGTAAYAQLGQAASEAIRNGADDEGEMGVYHHVHKPQRETNLRLRLDEYLRVGLEAGIFYET